MKDNKKINQTRRNRGYSFETHIVQKFQEHHWKSRRLGSPSNKLVDVFAVNGFYKKIVAVEAKSTTMNWAYVPDDQIERCVEWVNMLDAYEIKEVVLAFKFPAVRTGKKAIKRKLKYIYKVFPHKTTLPLQVKCNYDGDTFDMPGNKIEMRDFKF